MRIHVNGTEAMTWIAMAVFHLKRVANEAARSRASRLPRLIHVDADTRIHIDYRGSLASSIARITSGAGASIGYFNHVATSSSYLWKSDGSFVLVPNPVVSPSPVGIQSLSKNEKTYIFGATGGAGFTWWYRTGVFTLIGTYDPGASFGSPYALSHNGVRSHAYAEVSFKPELYLVDVLIDGGGVRSLSTEAYLLDSQAVFTTERAVLGITQESDGDSFGNIKFFPPTVNPTTPKRSVVYYSRTYTDHLDIVHHDTHRVTEFKTYAESETLTSSGTTEGRDWQITNLVEKGVWVVYESSTEIPE